MTIGTVAGRTVPAAALERRLDRMYARPAAAILPEPGSGEWRRLRRWVAQLVLTEELVRAEADARGVTGAAGDPAGTATSGSLSAAVLAGLPLARALRDRVTADVEVSEAAVRAYYERNPGRWTRPERVRLRHQLDDGPVQLWDRAVADLPRPLAAVVREAEVGAVVGPVRSPFGWHAARIVDRVPAGVAPLAEVAGDIRAELVAAARDREFDRWLERRRREVVVTAPGYEHPGDPGQPDFSHHH